MESRRSDLVRADGGGRGSGEAFSSVSASEGREVVGTEATSAWTGVKRPKIQSTPTPCGDLSNVVARDDAGRCSGEIVHGQDQEQIEGLEWDVERLHKEIQALRNCMPHSWLSSDDDDDDIEHFNEEQQKAFNQRLALCRIRGHKERYRALDDASLLKLFPPDVLERNFYYKRYECGFDWFFDPEYCKIARVEDDYQRMVLTVTSEFGDLDICPYTRNTLADDQQFVQFWEKLSRKTKLIELYIIERSCECQRIKNVLLYHALKIAEELPSVYKTPIFSIFREFMLTVEVDYTYAGFFTKMWELLAKKQMNFADALRCVFNEGKYRCFFRWGPEFEPNLSPIERIYKPHLDRIVKKAQDGTAAHQLVMDTILDNVWKPRRYYDYVRKKIRIAEEIQLIPKQPPHRLYSAGSIAKIACHVPLT